MDSLNVNVLDQSIGDNYVLYHGDCVDVMRGLPDASIDYSIYSVPFRSIFTYSASPRDLGNTGSDEDFAAHYQYCIREMYRLLKPGRLVSIHCMNLPTSKAKDGYIGLSDFRGEIIRAHIAEGFIYHSEVCIWKDPVTAMQRTKALGLLHKQIVKDSCMSRQGIADYLVTMRKPGVNADPVSGPFEEYIGEESRADFDARCRREWDRLPETDPYTRHPRPSFEQYRSINIWQRYASPVWMDIDQGDTLQHLSAREEKDERHICPLQIQVIRRGIELWSNPGEVVFSPFAGIGSELYVALEEGRRAAGAELKKSYFDMASKNLASVGRQVGLFGARAS